MNNQYPENVISKILQITLEPHTFAYLAVDNEGLLVNQGGNLAALGLPVWSISDNILQDTFFFRKFLPMSRAYEHIPSLQITDSNVVDVHMFDDNELNWAVLVDKTEELKSQNLGRQKSNELKLPQQNIDQLKKDPCREEQKNNTEFEFFEALDMMALYRDEQGTFSLLKPVSDRFSFIYPEAFSSMQKLNPREKFIFIENFMIDAEKIWDSRIHQQRVASGPWIEQMEDGEEVALHAVAQNWDGHQLLFISILNDGYRQNYEFLQRARENVLTKDLLEKEIEIRHQVEAGLIEARNAADVANKAKSEFLSTMSHEIRTPMNGVLGMADLLRDTALNEEQKHFVDVIQASGEAMLSVINDVLDFSKLEAHQVELEKTDFNLASLANNVVYILASQAESKQLKIVQSFSPKTDGLYRGDSARIQQILINLLGNAIKFTEQGQLTLKIDAEINQNKNKMLRIEVHDTGVGIAKEKINTLFDSFIQADASVTRKYGGSGLGLAISKGLTEVMGGAIGVESEFGKGSMFWIELPLPYLGDDKQTDQSDTQVNQDNKIPDKSRSRILLAEDNEVNQMVALGLLKALGFDNVNVVDNGNKAVQQLVKEDYDLVLMDIQMPECGGIEACLQIRGKNEHPDLGVTIRNPDIPVIALTANAMSSDINQCLAAGMNGHIGKPIDKQLLAIELKKWLKK